jgi:hypothetical protein
VASRGRPPVLDAIKKGEILALLTIGCSRRVAAQYVGCARCTIERTAQRDPAFGAKLQQAKTNTEIGFFKNIQKAAQKEQYWRAAAWALERMMPEKYARRSPDVITIEQIAVLLSQFTDIIVAEVPVAEHRKNLLKRLDLLTRALGGTPPQRMPESPPTGLAEERGSKPRKDKERKANHDQAAKRRHPRDAGVAE